MKIKLLPHLFLSLLLSLSATAVLADAPAPVVDAFSSAKETQKAQGNGLSISDFFRANAAVNTNHAPRANAMADNTVISQADNTTNSVSEKEEADSVSLSENLKNMSPEQRLARLEQQVDNIANMDLPQQISSLQQQVAQLRGQFEVQHHELQIINSQLRNFYKDLDKRINEINNLNSGNAKASSALNTATDAELQDANTYQVAFSQLVSRQLDKSKRGFENYINQYPNGKYVADSYYWLGEIYLSKKDFEKSDEAFETVISKYPKSSKVFDAKLKIAIIHANTGKVEQAKSELLAIKMANPNSTAAQLANIRLQQLEDSES